MIVYRLTHREPSSRTIAALQLLPMGITITRELRLALARLNGSETLKIIMKGYRA
jgi:hypothetical protein